MLFELTNLGYRYSDGTPALQELSFTIEARDRIVILGANGSGKSTLLRILDGLLFASSGAIQFQGEVLNERSLEKPEFRYRFRQSVGFVFQNADAQLFNATVYEELAFGPRQVGIAESEVTDRVNDILRYLGIEHLSERPPFRLSGGEKRKVAIASVLSMNPEVLIFDEPFLGLDPRSQSWLIKTLQHLHEAGKTIILATHTLDLVPRVATKAVVLSEAHELIACGPVDEILADRSLLVRANLVELDS